MTRVFVGIDPGTQCGWAVLDEHGNRVASGVWNLSPGRHEGGGMRFLRLERYVREVFHGYRTESCQCHSPALAYEEVRRHMGTDAAHVYGGVIATVTRICEDLGVPYRGIPVGTVKRLATGKGNAGKEAMVETALCHWGQLETCMDDEADALWIAEALRQELAP